MITMADVERWRGRLGRSVNWNGDGKNFANHVLPTDQGIVVWHESISNETEDQAAWDKQGDYPAWYRLSMAPDWVREAVDRAKGIIRPCIAEPDFTLDEIHAGQEMVK